MSPVMVAADGKASWPLKPQSPRCQMCKHLGREERYQIHTLVKAKQSISDIARFLGGNLSSISRELRRSQGLLLLR